MRILVQNKLLLAVVPPILHLDYISTTLFLGRVLAGHCTLPLPHTESKLGHSYVQLYLGKDPDSHSKAEQNPGISQDPAGHGLSLGPGSDPPPAPAFATCQVSPLEAKSSQGPTPGPWLPVLGPWDLRTFPKIIVKLQPWFVGFIPFHSKGFCGNVQLTGPKKSLKMKQLTRRRVKLM